jgi:membrane protein required for beta-lactamase induction
LLSRLWRDPRILLLAFLSAGGLFMLLQLHVATVAITLVLLHFYLDGVFWAFRKPEVRKSLGPYLMGWRNPGAQAPVRIGAHPSG